MQVPNYGSLDATRTLPPQAKPVSKLQSFFSSLKGLPDAVSKVSIKDTGSKLLSGLKIAGLGVEAAAGTVGAAAFALPCLVTGIVGGLIGALTEG